VSARPPKDNGSTIATNVGRPILVQNISDGTNRTTIQEHMPVIFQVAGALSTEKISWPGIE
jgi:hypothetical protein